MKRTFVRIAAVFTAAIFMSMLTAWAQTSTPPNTQTTSGSAGIAIAGAAGNQNTGGLTNGSGVGTYQATDPSSANGSALASAAGATTANPGTTAANSQSKVVVNLLTTANGATVGTTLGATGTQGNWASVGDTNPTFATAGNTTTGTGHGSIGNTPESVTGNGQEIASGNTAVTANPGTTQANSSIQTTGSSKAQMAIVPQDSTAIPTTSVGVSGTGIGQGQSVVGNLKGSSYSIANNTGATSYDLTTNAAGAEGKQSITGKTNSSVGPGTASASSVVQSNVSAAPLP